MVEERDYKILDWDLLQCWGKSNWFAGEGRSKMLVLMARRH